VRIEFARKSHIQEFLNNWSLGPEKEKAWCRASTSYPGLVAWSNGHLVGGCLMMEGTEPHCGGWLLHLRHFVTASGVEESQLLAPLADFAQQNGTPPDGWLAIEADPDSSLETGLRDAGFQPTTFDLRLNLEGKSCDLPSSVRTAKDADRRGIRQLSHDCLHEILPIPPGAELPAALQYCQDRWPTYSQDCDLTDPYLQFLVCHDQQGEVCGFLSLGFYRKNPWVDDLAVRKDTRGTRVARDLLLAGVAVCLQRGFEDLYAMIAAGNPRSWKPARRAGFQVVRQKWIRRFENRDTRLFQVQ
jgi:GNAT superfamily N-acetyltransferase